MKVNYQDYPVPPDKKYAALRNRTGDLPEEYWQEFLRDYAQVWAFWQNQLAPFCPQPLWEQGAPGFKEEFQQPQPSVGVKFHEGEPRGMILVCAGGGLMWKADYEGPVVAERFYQEGFNVAVLDYRVTPYTFEDAVGDAKRAMRYLRFHAKEFNTLSDKIAIGGFSAGGRLTNMVAAGFDYGDPDATDPIDQVSCRPDAAIPCYGSHFPASWPASALGYDRQLQKKLISRSADCLINADCPPYFIWQCAGMDDPRNAMNLATRLAIYGVPFELHLFPYGDHGTSLADGQCPNPNGKDPHVAHWVQLCVEWLKQMGF